VPLALAVTACGTGHEEEVEATAADFYAALADRDGAAACALLAPATRSELEQSSGKPCPRAVLEEKVPKAGDPDTVQVFGTEGQVTFDRETTFLGDFPQGWRVVAAGCTPREPRPYDCVLSGG